MGFPKTGPSPRNRADCGMIAIAVGSMQSWHDRPIHPQSGENREISVQSEIKPNPTAVGQPEGPLQSSRCPAIPERSSFGGRNPPAIETSRFAIHTIATGFWSFGKPDAIQADCTPIGPKSCPLRFHLDCDPRPQVGSLTPDPCPGILCNPRISQRLVLLTMAV